MASERKFVHKALDDYALVEYLQKSLDRAGVSSISVQRTPVATRITMLVQKPGMVVGKRGSGINEIVEEVKSRFGIDNPQVEVLEVAVPSLDAKLVAQKIGKQIELRGNVKQVMRMTLQDIMGAGAMGAELRIAGKVVGKGGKARTLTARQGFLKKSGESKRVVNVGKYTAYPKAGAIGVTVRILPPGAYLAEKIVVSSLKLPEKAGVASEGAAPASEASSVAQDAASGAKEEKTEKTVDNAEAGAPVEAGKPKRRSRKNAEESPKQQEAKPVQPPQAQQGGEKTESPSSGAEPSPAAA